MTKEDVKDLFKRINSHYSTFTADTFKLIEWEKHLKDYDDASVNYQLEKWLKSDYAKYEPKVTNLTLYAKKTTDVDKPIYIKCQLCGASMLMENYEKHYHRENSVDYIEKMAKKYFDKQIDRDKYLEMAQETFDSKYDELLKRIKDIVPDEAFYGTSTKQVIENILKEKE